jgi:hypothetical protein
MGSGGLGSRNWLRDWPLNPRDRGASLTRRPARVLRHQLLFYGNAAAACKQRRWRLAALWYDLLGEANYLMHAL